MRWTRDQQEAIDARGSNMLLSAAAGSGKTTVLVERVLSLIEQGASVDQMLIVTFSRAAAADMKAKLASRLEQRARERTELRVQADRVERASVCTLHAYCIDVLRGHFEAAGVDPAFRILDDAEAGQLEARALDAVLEDAFLRAEQGLLGLFYGRDARALRRMIPSLYHFAQSRPDPDAWLAQALTHLYEGDGSAWFGVLMDSALQNVAEARALGMLALDIACTPGGPNLYAPALEQDLDALDRLPSLGYDGMRGALDAFAPAKLRPLRVKDDDPDSTALREAAEQVKSIRKAQRERIGKANEALVDREAALEDVRESLPALSALKALAQDFGRAFDELKAERSALTFGDLERAALRALSDEHVASVQRARFAHVFVDEFQDVSDLQEAIVARVTSGDNLFMVGDVKQSIYRFRQAEPTLFVEKYRRYAEGDGGRLIALRENFRSRPSVLALVNRVFSRAMSGPRAELAYDEAAHLNPGASFPGEDPEIEVHLISSGAAQEEGEADMTAAQCEGALVARRILELLDAPFFDAKAGRERPLRPGDIAVLARTRAGLSACALMLRSAGVPCYLDASEGYFDALEVRIMLSLMETIENRRRDFPLLAVLRSPIVGLSSTQLAVIRAAHGQGPFYEAVRAYADKSDKAAQALRAFEARVARWRVLSRALPLPEWIDLLLKESGFYAYAGGMAGGAARQGNLDLLCAYASAFESAQAGGLCGFLDYVREVGRAGGDMGAAHDLGEGDDVVRLMTAHKSKGLEFPVVFAVQLGRPLAARRGGEELACHRTLGAALFYNDARLGTRRDTLPHRAIHCAQQREALEEEKRILYVLMTRAQHRLILVGSVRSRDAAQMRYRAAALGEMQPESFLDMIMPALPAQGEFPPTRVCWHEGMDAAPQEGAAQEKADPPSEDEVRALRDALMWRYPYEGEAFAPIKLTASGLTREVTGAAAPPPVSRRPRFLTGQGMTAAERGTLIHAALSALAFEPLRGLSGAELKAQTQAQIARLRQRNVLSASVDPGLLAAFFERDLGARLMRAQTVRREWPFNLRMTAREALVEDSDVSIVVQGVIDCCFMEDGAWVLLDYKTDRLDDEEAVLSRYCAQLGLYRRALERITGIPAREAYLCLLTAGKEIALSE